MLLYFFIVALGFNLLMFIPAYLFKTDKLTDMSYSVTFIALILAALFTNTITTTKIILASMVVLWGMRLGTFLLIRIHNMKRDKRFDGMREHFFKFIRFWILQGIAVWIILIPSFYFMTSIATTVCWLGLGVWLIGLILETVADAQKYNFNKNKKNKEKFIQTGVWKYSRHPNYFGEMLCWIGIYVFTFPALSLFEKIFGLASPLFIIILLLFVSGIPLLEKAAERKWGKQKDYQNYKKSTSVLIPWFKKH